METLKEQAERLNLRPDVLQSVLEVLTVHAGKDHFEIIMEGGLAYVTIHYPEIVIWNEQATKIVTKDVYVRYYLTRDGVPGQHEVPFRACFTKPTATQRENGVVHTHGNGVGFWGKFCMGIGPLPLIREEIARGFTKQKFTAFVIGVKTYLEFENNMDRTHLKQYINHSGWLADKPSKGDMKAAMEMCMEDLTPEMFKFEIADNTLKATATEDLEFFLGEKLRDFPNLIAGKRLAGGYCQYGQSYVDNGWKGKLFIFKFLGKEVYLETVMGPNDQQNDRVSHPALTAYVCGEVTKHLTKFLVRYGKERSDPAIGQDDRQREVPVGGERVDHSLPPDNDKKLGSQVDDIEGYLCAGILERGSISP